MTAFDAELYLRLLGERGLLHRDPNQGPRGNRELLEAARALLAVGAIEKTEASEIVDAYMLVEGLRRGRGHLRGHRLAAATSAQPTPHEQRRTVSCNTTIERPAETIRVRSIMLSESETRLSVVIQATAAGSGTRNRRAVAMHGRFNFQVADDRGGRSSTSFGGGGSDHEWRGQLTASQPLAVDTAWIELDGSRIELDDSPSASTVSVEPLPEAPTAKSYLWHWLATPQRHGPEAPLEAVLDALTASGSVDAEDPVLGAVRAVADGRQQARLQGRHGSNATLPSLDVAPADWRSVLAPLPSRRSAQGMIAVAAAPPPFEGISLIVETLIADVQGWQLEVDATPGIASGPFDFRLDDTRVAWWAVDDRGQYYLGHFGNYNSAGGHMSGTIEFTLPLDRAASTLTLLPTGPTERARIEVPLTWTET